ncbi:MAG: protein-L-isoaspartate(D-aspartate) O-methyltransferase [Alphaproteobacteria bacterium]|nr:protein-L-isoaspartate(D-aspartate) O-methyltransferase [Alphaproteobacteria bacterium]
MALTIPDTTAKRIRLIMHLRKEGITDTAVLAAMEKIPREIFVPEAVRHQAWDDIALPIACGQTISQPFIVATMTAALDLKANDKVLEIGTGCGYQTAILAQLCRRVYSIERHKPLLKEAEARFRELNITNIVAICADGMKGWPTIHGVDQAPFDKIIVTAAAREKPPQALLDQLKIGGMMIIPVGENGQQVLRRYKKESEEAFAVKDVLPVRFVPLLPDTATGG